MAVLCGRTDRPIVEYAELEMCARRTFYSGSACVRYVQPLPQIRSLVHVQATCHLHLWLFPAPSGLLLSVPISL